MNTPIRADLRQKAKSLEPILRIGKKGITPEQIGEIKKLMRNRDLVKIKLLRSALSQMDRRAAAKAIAKDTGCEVVEATGFTITLFRRKLYKPENRGTD